jgi:hypothetical protein
VTGLITKEKSRKRTYKEDSLGLVKSLCYQQEYVLSPLRDCFQICQNEESSASLYTISVACSLKTDLLASQVPITTTTVRADQSTLKDVVRDTGIAILQICLYSILLVFKRTSSLFTFVYKAYKMNIKSKSSVII